MNHIDVSFYEREEPFWVERLVAYCEKILEFLEHEDWEISIVLTTDSRIRELNREYRGLDSPTDVLSFCQNEGESIGSDFHPSDRIYAGDIVISLETLEKNAEEFSVGIDEEFRRLLIHGILHLDGWEHATNNVDEEMLVYQEQILRNIGEKIL